MFEMTEAGKIGHSNQAEVGCVVSVATVTAASVLGVHVKCHHSDGDPSDDVIRHFVVIVAETNVLDPIANAALAFTTFLLFLLLLLLNWRRCRAGFFLVFLLHFIDDV